MKTICLWLVIVLICGETFSCFGDCHEIHFGGIGDKISLRIIAGTLFITLLPSAPSAKAGILESKFIAESKDALTESISSVPNHVIDEILRKAALEKSKREQKKKEQESGLFSKDDEKQLDPMKCFPKALCGVSSEVTQISKRRKNGLITEYLVLMKKVASHPEVLNEVVTAKAQGISLQTKYESEENKEDEVQKDISSQDDDEDDASGSEEDDQNDSGEDDDEEDDEPQDDEKPAKKRDSKKKPKVKAPKPDDLDHEEYMKEKVEMDLLMKELMNEESQDEGVWWDDTKEPPYKNPSASGSWGSQSQRPRPQGYGGSGPPNQRRPNGGPGPQGGPGPRPYFRGEPMMEQGGYDDQFGPPAPMDMPYDAYGPPQSSLSGGGGGGFMSSLFSQIFGYGGSSIADDPWFQSAARDLKGDISPGIGVDETREILETAIEIGKSFDQPSQCNEIFNACKYEYTDLLYMIDDLRRGVRHKVHELEKEKENRIKAAKKAAKSKKSEKAKWDSEQSDLGNQKPKQTKNKNSSKSKSEGKKENSRKEQRSKKKTKKHFSRPSSLTSGSDETSGEDPAEDERWVVIPVEPPTQASFSIQNVLSWFGVKNN